VVPYLYLAEMRSYNYQAIAVPVVLQKSSKHKVQPMLRLRVMLLGLVVCLLWTVNTKESKAAEIDYIEDFALAADRAAVLEQLIPGTEDYYYYHCLHFQNNEQYDKVDDLLKDWIKRYNYSNRVQEIRYRQALLTYNRNPQGSLEFIRKELGINFNHQREILGRKPNLPSALNPNLVNRETLTKNAIARYKNTDGFEERALDWLINSELDPDRRRHLLGRLQRPDHTDLPKLIVDDLNYRNSRGFGSFKIHQQMLLSQLDECLRLKPDLLNQSNFVNVYLSKLQPNSDVDWQHDDKAYDAYLNRLSKFVKRLDPVHNSLKAHVAYHRLAFERSKGVYDEAKFLSYIKLPRNVSYINSDYMKIESNRRYACNLNQDYRTLTLLAPIGNDEPLVRSYLHHFFVKGPTFKPYEPYINDTYLKHNFAETKIVNGLGDPEQWYSMLPPEKYQQLKDRIDLDFSHSKNRVFTADQAVSVDLFVKNVPSLIVKVYEINTKNFYREQGRQVNTDINLDGLVPNYEQTYDYADPPLRRMAKHFDFKKLDKPGVYVIDFIGNGKSSRVVIRKGGLRYLVRSSTAGHIFTILGEQNQVLKDATLWMAGRQYTPNEDGSIVTPYSTNPSQQSIILQHGDFAALQKFQHESENYQLVAGFYVDREELISHGTAQVVIRPGLYVNAVPVSLSLLEDVELAITSTDHDGVVTTKKIQEFKLFEDREATFEFNVPRRLSRIEFRLNGQVKNLSQNKKVAVSYADSFSLNGIDRTEKVEHLHLVRADGQHIVELLGRTGEPKSDRAVRLSIKHKDFKNPVNVTLKTDGRGRVFMGELKDIAWLNATGPENTSQRWQLFDQAASHLQSMHGLSNQTIQLPLASSGDKPLRSELSLLELRGGKFVTDRFASLSVVGGSLRVGKLPAGDYDLLHKTTGSRIQLRVTDGQIAAGYALGNQRYLELRGDKPLQIANISTAEKKISVKLQNATKFARVHVFATHYYPAFSAFARLDRVHDIEPTRMTYPRRESLYAEGRKIGDEYQYIINRRLASRFPGNMLQRPELLLNPYSIRGTDTTNQTAASGDSFERKAEGRSSGSRRQLTNAYGGKSEQQEFSNLDFLADASAVLLNLTPDENGMVVIDQTELGNHQHIQIVAVDPRSTVFRSVSLEESPSQRRDLRLVDGLSPDKHFTQQKQISVVSAGNSFEMRDITSSKYESYDSLGGVYSLYVTLTADPKLVEFAFVIDWPNLSPEEKQAKYSKYACHELNVFLFKKDPKFFRTIIAPYLANKKDPTFMDRWLLNAGLEPYTEPWNYEQLNTVERILLATRINNEQQYTSRLVRDTYDLIPPNVDLFNQLFNTAVKTSALDANGDGEGFENAKKSLQENSRGLLGAVKKFAAPPLARPQPGEPQTEAPDLRARSNKPGEKRSAPSKTDSPQDEDVLEDFQKNKNDDYFAHDREKASESLQKLYRKLDKTKEWGENNYYRLTPNQQNSNLVQTNAFWVDFAEHDPKKPFYSAHLANASRNFTEMMFALSVLDLPFEAKEHKTNFDREAMKVDAASPMIVFHEEIKPAELVADQAPILVSQNFFRHGDRYQHVNNQQMDKYVSEEFLVHVVYGCHVVLTNPTSAPRKLDLLLQIPVGAMPVMNGQYTRTANLDLQPYSTRTVEYYFYFPAAGEYEHYPVHVASDEQVVAYAEPFNFNVVEELSEIDTTSWDYVSQNGTEAQVLDYLKKNNLHRTKLDRIAWRMQDKPFFSKVISLLTARHAYNHTLWSYGIKHDQVTAVNQYLQHAPSYLNRCGLYLVSPLVKIDPVARKTYQHLEYKPLVNARAHQLGRERQILNAQFHAQYHRHMKVLSYRRELDSVDQMAVTYYMLLQDRVEDAMNSYSKVNSRDLATQLHYDYFSAYLSFFKEDQQIARDISERYSDYPVDRWREAFASVRSQLDELDGNDAEVIDEENLGQQQTKLATTEPNFEFKVENKQISIDFQNLADVKVNYYLMDIELLFSRNPFVQRYSGQFSLITPNDSAEVALPEDKPSLSFDLPKSLHNENVLVEIVGAGQTKTQAYYSNSLSLQVIENFGQVRVLNEKTRAPMPKTYVKVYAKMANGKVQFYKDGYTDIRGRFDYASLSTNELDYVQRFALLVMSETGGAVVREAAPPKR